MFHYLTLRDKIVCVSPDDKDEFLLEHQLDDSVKIKVKNLYLHENGKNDKLITGIETIFK